MLAHRIEAIVNQDKTLTLENLPFDSGEQDDGCHPKKTGRLTIQLDEMWSFVGFKDNKQWVWLAIDTDSREIVGVFVGDRSRQSASLSQ